VISQKGRGGGDDEKDAYHLLLVDSDVVDIKSRYAAGRIFASFLFSIVPIMCHSHPRLSQMYIINFAEAAKVSLQIRAYKHLDKDTQIANIQSAIAKIESILNESGQLNLSLFPCQ
jgi:hypothetical protein